MDAAFSFDGHQMVYRMRGQKTAPTVLILPGNTATSALHTKELEFFESLGFQAIAPDLLGTGRSSRLARPWPVDWFEQNAAACAALLDHLPGTGETPPALVCGTSGGAIVALWMAILYPGKVKAVIADSLAIRFSPSMFRALEADRLKRHPEQIAFWRDAQGDDWLEVVDADTELFLSIERERALDGVWDIHQGRLHEIDCPILFTCSLTDDLIPAAGAQMLEMATQVRGSLYFAANQGAHPLMWSYPQAFQSAAAAFIESLQK